MFKNNSKPKIIEQFGLFTKKSASVSNDITRSFDNSVKIDSSFNTKNINNIMNTAINNVSQESSADILVLTIQSNEIKLTNITCPTIAISGNRQSNVSESHLKAEVHQTKVNNIASDIMDKVSTKITNQVPDNTEDMLKQMNASGAQFMNNTSTLDKMNKATMGNIASGLSGGAFSIGGSTSVNVKNKLDESMKQALDINKSINIDTTQNFSNNLSNDIDQISNSRCGVKTMQQNKIVIQGALCNALTGSVTIANNSQTNAAKAYLDCLITQNSTNKVSQKITSNIDNYFKSYVENINPDDPGADGMLAKITDIRKMYYFLIDKASKEKEPDTTQPPAPAAAVPAPAADAPPAQDDAAPAAPAVSASSGGGGDGAAAASSSFNMTTNQKYAVYGVVILILVLILYKFMK
jgi:hypothetical protein